MILPSLSRLACVASVTVAFFAKKPIFAVLDAREMGREQKQGGVGEGRGEEAKVSFLPLSSPPPSLFSFSPHFARVQKYENRLFSAENSTETLATQAISRQIDCFFDVWIQMNVKTDSIRSNLFI